MMNADIRRRCEAIAKLEQQRKELAAEIKELKAKAKADGYDVSLMTKTVNLMLKDADKQKKAIEQHSLFDSYLAAVGLLPDDDISEPQSDGASRPAESSGELEQSKAVPAAPISGAEPVRGAITPEAEGVSLTPSALIQILPSASPAAPVAASEAAGESSPPAADLSIPDFLRRVKQTEAA